MSRNLVISGVVIAVVIVGGWFLMRPKAVPVVPVEKAMPVATESAVVESTVSADTSMMKEINVAGSEFAFTPKTISVKKGEKVKLTFTNAGKYPHNLKIDDLGVATKVTGVGKTEIVEFTANKSGSFSMYCSVGDHKVKGMEGTVSVE